MVQLVKNLPAMLETQVQSLGQEGPLEKGMATHSSILAWRIPWTEEPGGLHSMVSQRMGHSWVTNTFTFIRVTKLESPDKQMEGGMPRIFARVHPIGKFKISEQE